MTAIVARDYQRDALTAIEEAHRAHQATVAVCPTGSGKTVIFGLYADRRRHKGRVMVLAHREELIEQAADKIRRITNCPIDVEMADRRASELNPAPIVVSSIQTQTSGKNGNRRMRKFSPNDFALVVCDECHHSAADTWRETIAHYAQNPNCKILGVTATPRRTDQKALACVFDSVAFRMGILDGIREGWLVDIDQRFIEIKGLDYSGIQVRGGDFVPGQLSIKMCDAQAVEAVCAAVHQIASDKKSLVFCVDVEHAMAVTKTLNEYNPGYAHIVTGMTPSEERKTLINRYRKSEYPCLVNCMIATEGFDVPDIQAVVMARPTKSALLYEQMLGRGTRPTAPVDNFPDAASRRAAISASDKPNMLVVDFVGNSLKHEIVTVLDVLGGQMPGTAKELAERELDEGGGLVTVAIDSALQSYEKTRFAKAVYQERKVSPFKKNDPYALFGIEYEKGEKPIEPWQREKLEKWRMPVPDTSEEAQDLIDEVRSRTRRGLCTYRMGLQLKRHGHDPNMSFEDARKIMDELSKNWGPR